ncbi:MAG: hypothetical protein M1826_005538 [Phylliscum demangeonii]|nr:MAG: hypothetical protein M1826_005538 [Phylliscum demangeonii]
MALTADVPQTKADDARPRKRMRKGTHSCLECKRRKVRCTFLPGDSTFCIECTQRGSLCVSQDQEDLHDELQSAGVKKNVRDRVGRLEAMVEQLLHKLDSRSPSIDEGPRGALLVVDDVTGAPLTPSTTPSDSPLDFSGSVEAAPLLSLFDNAIGVPDARPPWMTRRQRPVGLAALRWVESGVWVPRATKAACVPWCSFAEKIATPSPTSRGIGDARRKITASETQCPSRRKALESMLTAEQLRRDESESSDSSGHEEVDPLSDLPGSLLQTVLGNPKDKHAGVRQALLSILPPQRTMTIIFRDGGDWWNVWKEICPLVSTDEQAWSLPQFASAAFRKSDPVSVAHVILCLAISVQQLPVGYDQADLQLPVPAEQVLQHYVSAVHRLVTSDDDLVASMDGLDCLLLQGKCHVNLGQPRRAWLIGRRAATLAMLLGLHRHAGELGGASAAAAAATSLATRRAQTLWLSIYQVDRYMSLLLGLPYYISDRHMGAIPAEGTLAELDYSLYCWKELSVLSGQIVDLLHDAARTPVAVDHIDRRLLRLVQRAPAGWWMTGSSASASTAPMPLPEFFKRIVVQFAFYHVRQVLHVRAVTQDGQAPGRQVCLSSAREVIRCYHFLRGDPLTRSHICRVVDFQAFTAVVLLLLNLLSFPPAPGPAEAGAESESRRRQQQRDADDWALVEDMIRLMRSASAETCGLVAVQALRVLEFLTAARNRGPEIWGGQSVKLVIPYFGTIQIAPGAQLRRMAGSDLLTAPNTMVAEEEEAAAEEEEDVRKQRSAPPPPLVRADARPTPMPMPMPMPIPMLAPEPAVEDPIISFRTLLDPMMPSDPMPLLWSSAAPAAPATVLPDDGLLNAMADFETDQAWNWFWNDAAVQ